MVSGALTMTSSDPRSSLRFAAPAFSASPQTDCAIPGAERIQYLYMAGRKSEAIDAVPDELVRNVSLIGPSGFVKERVAAFAEAGVTTLLVSPLATDRTEYLRYVAELIGMIG